VILHEHHAKQLLAARGIPIPHGILVRDPAEVRAVASGLKGPWIVKAQVAVGGRGKAGAIRRVADAAALEPVVGEVLGMEVKGRPVRACRIEESVDFASEAYLSISLDPAAGGLRVMLSTRGGIDVEETSVSDRSVLRVGLAEPDVCSVRNVVDKLVTDLPAPQRQVLRDAGFRLVEAMLPLDVTFLEINPVFVMADGGWIAGDVKMIADTNSIGRHEELTAIVEQCPDLYPETALKLRHGFDYVALDPDGEVGLLTTGAGLSMMIVDELARHGISACNFCDIRTGQLRGDPTRVVQVLEWISQAPRLKVVHVNIFAGITNLGEFATLLVRALDTVPALARVPLVVRLIGNAADEARAVLGLLAANGRMQLEPDFDRAIALVVAHAADAGVTVRA
jgi:succinyl-CoA synthetase beta subunit